MIDYRNIIEFSSAVGEASGLMLGTSLRGDVPPQVRENLALGAEQLRVAYQKLTEALQTSGDVK